MIRRPPISTRTTLSLHDALPISGVSRGTSPNRSATGRGRNVPDQHRAVMTIARRITVAVIDLHQIAVAGARAGIRDHAGEIGRAPSELQSLMRISYAVFCVKKKKQQRCRTTKEQQ